MPTACCFVAPRPSPLPVAQLGAASEPHEHQTRVIRGMKRNRRPERTGSKSGNHRRSSEAGDRRAGQ